MNENTATFRCSRPPNSCRNRSNNRQCANGMIRQFLKDVAWGPLDYLVVDSPPGTGDEPLSIAQLVGSPAGAVIVTTPQDLSISDVRRCISFCRSLSLPIVGIIENMSGFVCPNCGAVSHPFKSGGGKALALDSGLALLGRIPLDPAIVASSDDGTPFVVDNADSAAGRAFAEVTQSILALDGDIACKTRIETNTRRTTA